MIRWMITTMAAAAALIMFLAAGAPARPSASTSSGVTIRNDKFEVTHVVTGKRDLRAFRTMWGAKKRVNPAKFEPQWRYKIDLADGSRWLYDVRGFTQLVSLKKVILYKLPSVKRFNRLIKAVESPRMPGVAE